MTIRIDLLEGGRFIELVADGHVTRREAGWATERVREMVRENRPAGILADAGGVELQASPVLSGELIESFLFAIEDLAPIAYVRPSRWTPDYFGRVIDHVGDLPHSAHYFEDRASALHWLKAQAAADA